MPLLIAIVFGLALGCSGDRDESRLTDGRPATATALDSVVRALLIDGRPFALDRQVTLDSVANALGLPTPDFETGEHGVRAKCFVLTDQRGGRVLLTVSTNEIGGPRRRLLGYGMRDALDAPSTVANCAVGDSRVRALQADNGIYLGMPAVDALSRLGEPTDRTGDRLTFNRTIPRTAGGGAGDGTTAYHETSVMTMRVRDGLVAEFECLYMEII
jgi:hypothetical protein